MTPSTTASLSMPWTSGTVQARLEEIQAGAETGSDADLALARSAADAAALRLNETGLMLHAGTNAVLAAEVEAHDAHLGSRAICGPAGAVGMPGVPQRDDLDVLEVLAARAVGRAMGGPHADVRPQSGTLANLAVYTALVPVGATIAALPALAGAHFSHHRHGAAGIRGHEIAELPMDPAAQDVDLDRLPAFLDRERPGLVILGGSVQLFPNDVAAVVALAAEVGAKVMFDAAHVAGLIPGGAFPNPLDQGAAAMTFSTYKSFGGPAGGAIVTRDAEVARAAGAAVFPGLTANYDVGRLRPLHAAATALLRDGQRYGGLCVAAARALAEAFVAQGIDVMAAELGYTATNQVLVRMPDPDAAAAAVRRCVASQVFLSATRHADGEGASAAIRIGVQELVRRGLGPAEMPEVAAIVGSLLHGDPPPEEMRRAVRGLRELMAAPGTLNRSWPLAPAP